MWSAEKSLSAEGIQTATEHVGNVAGRRCKCCAAELESPD